MSAHLLILFSLLLFALLEETVKEARNCVPAARRWEVGSMRKRCRQLEAASHRCTAEEAHSHHPVESCARDPGVGEREMARCAQTGKFEEVVLDYFFFFIFFLPTTTTTTIIPNQLL